MWSNCSCYAIVISLRTENLKMLFLPSWNIVYFLSNILEWITFHPSNKHQFKYGPHLQHSGGGVGDRTYLPPPRAHAYCVSHTFSAEFFFHAPSRDKQPGNVAWTRRGTPRPVERGARFYRKRVSLSLPVSDTICSTTKHKSTTISVQRPSRNGDHCGGRDFMISVVPPYTPQSFASFSWRAATTGRTETICRMRWVGEGVRWERKTSTRASRWVRRGW